MELAFAMLYLGEGTKGNAFSIGSSSPIILQFILATIKSVYDITADKVSCQLHIRADQIPESVKTYWSQTLNIPIGNFKTVMIDKRTEGRKTYENYNVGYACFIVAAYLFNEGLSSCIMHSARK